MKILAINWASAFDVVFFGFGMVLAILIVLVLVLTLFGKILAPKVKLPKQTSEAKSKEETADYLEDHLPAEYSAAIAMAIHLYYSDEHDVESQIITIKTVQRRYSPWSSKIYGLNNLVK